MKTESTLFVCQLTKEEQKQIKEAAYEYCDVHDIYGDFATELISNVMDCRVCELAPEINVDHIIPQQLLDLIKRWDYDFKGYMMEGIEEDFEKGMTLKESVEAMINEAFPIWISECTDDIFKELYEDYKARFISVLDEL